MVVINIHEAKTHLSRLIDNAIRGEPFVIAKAGRPLVKVEALAAAPGSRRVGGLVGQIAVPDDFDTMGTDAMATLFSGGDISA